MKTFSVLLLFALVGCDKSEKPQPAKVADPVKVETKTPVVWKGLSTPESVYYDADSDAYLVSNIEGKPAEVDGKGFIARLTPDGTIGTLRWIEGGKNKVTLNAPKGMAILEDHLYVADIDTVRIFDKRTGGPVADVKIPGASFLNDMVALSDKVLVSDMGVNGKFESVGTDAIYAIDKNKKVSSIARGKELSGPNGLAVNGDRTWVATFGAKEVYALDATGKKTDVQTLPKGQLDGLLVVNGDIIVSSWEAKAIYRGKPGGPFTAIVEDVKAPADIGYDTKRNRLLVPLFEDNEVRAYEAK